MKGSPGVKSESQPKVSLCRPCRTPTRVDWHALKRQSQSWYEAPLRLQFSMMRLDSTYDVDGSPGVTSESQPRLPTLQGAHAGRLLAFP